MAEIHLPPQETKKWTQPNLGELLGILWATFNIDLSTQKGKVLLSKRCVVVNSANDSGLSNLVYPSACIRSNIDGTDRWWILGNTRLFRTTSAVPSAFVADSTTSSPTDLSHLYSDMVEFEDDIVVSTSTDLHLNSGSGTWTLSWWTGAGQLNQAVLTTSIPHPLHVSNRVLYIGDGNKLHKVDRNYVVNNTRLQFKTRLQIRCIRSIASGKIFIGTLDTYQEKAVIIEWDSYTNTYNNEHELIGTVVLAIVIKDNIPYAITDAGILYQYNGLSFSPIAYLPVFSDDIIQYTSSSRKATRWGNSSFSSQNISVHWNGMEVVDDKIHIFLSGSIQDSDTRLLDNMKGGIWCYDPDVGLYHRYSLSRHKTSDTIKDYGAEAILKTGFIKKIPKESGLFLIGAAIFTNSEASFNGIFKRDSEDGTDYAKRGYFITSKIQISDIKSYWQKIWAKFRIFRDSSTAIVIKIKEADDENFNFPFSATINWTNSTTFTSTDTPFTNVSGGEEVEIIYGDGSGGTAHISTISYSAPTYTVVIDEAISSNITTGQVVARISKWRKVKKISSTTITTDWGDLAGKSNWIQLKIELRGKKDDPEVEELIAVLKPLTKADS